MRNKGKSHFDRKMMYNGQFARKGLNLKKSLLYTEKLKRTAKVMAISWHIDHLWTQNIII